MINNKKIIAPSILSANLNQLEAEVLNIEKAGADWIHVDVMDGHFVPNITFGANIVKHLRQLTSLPIDVHLMVTNPGKHILSFIRAGASSISVHFEAVSDFSIFQEIKNHKVLAGAALKPKTPVESLFPFLNQLDLIVVMTVEPGLSGQKLMTEPAEKIQKIKKQLNTAGEKAQIAVDGGVSQETLKWVQEADILISGHYIFKSKNYSKAVQNLRKSFYT